MNAQRVNSAAGVILAALTQGRTAAGIALALESAGLLMSPEAAADIASVSTEAVRVAEESVAELRREHEESARLRARVDELEAAPTIADVVAYLSKKAREYGSVNGRQGELQAQAIETLADKISRGAIRPSAVEPADDDVSPQVAKLRALLAGQREALEDPHESPLHHTYRVPRDLPRLGDAS